MNLLKHLFWRDLSRVAEDPFLAPPLRRLAGKILLDRLPELTVGEKITLARISGRALLPRLMDEQLEVVLDALLWNNHLTEDDVIARVNSASTPAGTLQVIGRHPRWRPRYGVRVALVRNSRTPLAVSLGCLTSLTEHDLNALADNDDTPKLLRLACARVLTDDGWRRRQASRD